MDCSSVKPLLHLVACKYCKTKVHFRKPMLEVQLLLAQSVLKAITFDEPSIIMDIVYGRKEVSSKCEVVA